ncbi:MAG: hypothetical protein WBN31_06120 [Gammaproteobacteria bacterium]
MKTPMQDRVSLSTGLMIGLLVGLLATAATVHAYPIDAYDETGIRRLDYYDRAQRGEVNGRKLAPGAMLSNAAVVPRLTGTEYTFEFESDPAYASQLKSFLGEDADRYGLAVLDVTDPEQPIYAEYNGGIRENVGSVGKMLVGLAFFQTLADIYPDDLAARERVLKDTWIVADDFVNYDHHEVVFWDPDTMDFSFRKVHPGDSGSLFEWLDWMLSASNNGAASTVEKQLILLKHFGRDYPVSVEQEQTFFAEHGPRALGEIFLDAMNGAVVRNGLNPDLLRQGSFFTRTGKQKVAGTSSYGNPRELVHLLMLVEQGRMVDAWSSTEMKRLLYMTQKRIRYASHPALLDYAVYFKSGSLYSCQPEPEFVCKKYQGNKRNQLASVAIVEGPEDTQDVHYLVAVSSNVLYKNSAVAHQTLAMRIHRMVEARHAERLAQRKAERAAARAAVEAEAALEAAGAGADHSAMPGSAEAIIDGPLEPGQDVGVEQPDLTLPPARNQ